MFKKKGVFPKAKSNVPEEALEDKTLREEPEALPSEEAEAPEDENFLPFAEDEDFFKEPDFNETLIVEEVSEGETSSPLPDLSEDMGFTSAVEGGGESDVEGSFDSGFEEEDLEEKSGKSKKTLLLVLLLVILGGYAVYAFVLPQFSSDTAAQKQTVTAKKVTQRIPIKKPQPVQPAKQVQPAKPEAAKKAPEKTAAAPAPKETKPEQVEKEIAKAKTAPPAAKPKVVAASIPPENIRVIKAALPATAEKGYLFSQAHSFLKTI